MFILKISEEIKDKGQNVSKINTLENFDIDNISRTNYFDGKNVPLNSIIQLIVIPDEELKISAIATHAITDMTTLENIMKKGWFLNSPAGDVIDMRFLFGESKIVYAEELRVETEPWDGQSEMTFYSVEDISEGGIVVDEIEETSEDNTQYVVLAIIIVIGVGAAIFYLKGYKPKR